MSSTVGHALCGVTCLLGATAIIPRGSFHFNWRGVALFMTLANLPDIDFLVGYLVASDAHAFHQGPTHCLLFAVVMGLLLGFVFRRRLGLWPATIAFTLTIVSHDVVDVFSGPAPGFNRSPGIALLWPFDTEMVSAPFTIFPGILHENLEQLVSLHNAIAMIYEAAVFLPLIALLLLWLAKRGRIAGRMPS